MAVPLGKVVRDPSLLPALSAKATVVQQAERDARADFLLRRGKALLAANPAWQANGAEMVADSAVASMTAQLTSEVTTAAAKMTTLTAAMADPTKTELLPLDSASIDPAGRFRTTYYSLFRRTPEQLRGTAVAGAGWATLAENLATSDDDLHSLVSRRLMTAERMLWYVGVGGSHSWDFAAGRHKEWQDGWNRIFEYGRIPVANQLVPVCNAAQGSRACDSKGPMAGWEKRFGGQFRHDSQVNPTAAARWPRRSEFEFFFDKQAGAADPAQAILDVFTPSRRFDQRNLLYCDQVIDCLHLEALVRVKSRSEGNRAWLKSMTDPEADGWLRIATPSSGMHGDKYLVGDREARLFDLKVVDMSELAVGDHVIVFNHPAYDMAKESVDVWRLENALVVATSPRLLLQGHGTNPLPFTSARRVPVKNTTEPEPSMRFNMLKLFNRKLGQLRDAAKRENAKAKPRTEINDFDSKAVLVQRTDTGRYSKYDPSDFTPDAAQLARWWIRWRHDDSSEHGGIEDDISTDTVWAQNTWDSQRVEVTLTHCYFPLWRPRLDKGAPVRRGGKISAVEAVFVEQPWAPGWKWYYSKDESPSADTGHQLVVRCPKVS